MADLSHSPSHRSKSLPTKPRGRQKTKNPSSRTKSPAASLSAAEKDARRRHLALDKQFDKAQKRAEAHKPHSSEISPSPTRTDPPRLPQATIATATFTLTIAGLRQEENQTFSMPQEMCDLIAQTVARGIDAALTQRGILAPLSTSAQDPQASCAPSHLSSDLSREAHSPSPSHHSNQSLMDEGETFDHKLSGDEEETADRPHSTGLFHHKMFKTLLHKAKITANMGVGFVNPEGPSDLPNSNSSLFTKTVTEEQTIPSPKIFIDTIQHQWSQPDSIATLVYNFLRGQEAIHRGTGT